MAETIAGKGAVTHDHPAHVGPIGVIGSSSANEMAGAADVIIAIGTRLQDFTTGSWTVFAHDAQFVSINAARYDATKHRALAVVGDAKETVTELEAALGGWKADAAWTGKGKTAFKGWNDLLDAHQKPTNAAVPTYAQVVGVVNKWAAPNDTMVTAAGGLPGETAKGWRIKNPNTYDLEFGFSAMGYEIAGGWGHAMAKKGDGETIVMVGDGSYLMMNSDIYSTVLTGHKLIVIVCDNGGYAVINRLQNFKGTPSFNNLIKDSRVKEPFAVNFAKHAELDGRGHAALREPRRPRGRIEMGQDDRPHHGDLHRHRRLRLGAGRCRLGRGRAGSVRPARGAARRASTTRRSARSNALESETMKAKLGMSPIAWWNDDLPQLSDDVSLEECLRQSRSAGFTGMEQGRRFPGTAAEMLPIAQEGRRDAVRRLVLRHARERVASRPTSSASSR